MITKILITGASRGIGDYLAGNLKSAEYEVYGTYYHTKPATDLQDFIVRIDVTDEAQVSDWIGSIVKNGNEKLCLINCAGLNYNAILHKSDTVSWMQMFETNLKAAYLLMKHTIPFMRSNQFGRIINISSVVPLIGVPGTSAYSASKAALWGLTRTAAIENASYGITVNTLNLGYFDIGMIQEVPQNILEKIIEKIPTGKLGDPVNILNAVKFLLASDYITGSQININGGLY